MRAQLMGDGCSSMRHDVGVTTPGDPASPPSGPWDSGRDDDGVVERREPQSWSPDPLVPARGVPAPGTGGQVSWTPENMDVQWTAMEQQLRDDESLARAFARYEREAGRPRSRRQRPEAWRVPSPVTSRAPRRDSSPITGFLVIVIVVVSLIAGYSRWGPNRADPTLTVPMSDLADMPRVTSRLRPPAGFEEQRERLLPAVSTQGLVGTYEFLNYHDQMPVTWSPCRPLRVVVDTARAPDDFVDWVSHVLAEASELTGLQIILDGTTSERVSFEREAYQPDRYGGRWAPVIIGFADEAEIPGLAGTIAGLGGSSALELGGSVGYVTGAVAIDTTMLDYPRYAGEPGYVQVLRHEVGHMLGLDHVEDRDALMHPSDSTRTSWGPGDRAGFAVLGSGECQPNL